jgi:hypothetical protein
VTADAYGLASLSASEGSPAGSDQPSCANNMHAHITRGRDCAKVSMPSSFERGPSQSSLSAARASEERRSGLGVTADAYGLASLSASEGSPAGSDWEEVQQRDQLYTAMIPAQKILEPLVGTCAVCSLKVLQLELRKSDAADSE